MRDPGSQFKTSVTYYKRLGVAHDRIEAAKRWTPSR